MPESKPKFTDIYGYVGGKGEPGGGKIVVDTSGYLPAELRIRNIMTAGEILSEYRREMYHFGPELEETDEEMDFEDVTKDEDFDYEDAHRYKIEALRRYTEKKKAKEETYAKKYREDIIAKHVAEQALKDNDTEKRATEGKENENKKA